MVAVDLQALGGVGVQIEAAALQCILGRCNGVCMTADAVLLPAQWRGDAVPTASGPVKRSLKSKGARICTPETAFGLDDLFTKSLVFFK